MSSARKPSIADRPEVQPWPIMYSICTGAGLRANTCSRLPAVCPARSTSTSMPSCRTLLGHFGIAAANGRTPMIRHGAEALRRGVLDRQFGVAEQLDLGVVVRSQQRLGEQGDRVGAEIRRDVADAETPAGRAVECELWLGRRQRTAVAGVPLLVFGEQRLGRHVVAIVQAEQDVAVRQREVRAQPEGLAQRCFGLRQPALAHQGATEVVVCVAVLRIELDRSARRLLRLAGAAVQRQHPGQVGPAIGEVWRQAQRGVVAGHAFLMPARIAQDVAQVVVRLHPIGRQRQGGTRRCLGVAEPPEHAQHRGVVGVLLGVVGGGGDGGGEVTVGVVEAGFAMGDQAGDMGRGRGGGVAGQDPFGELFGRVEVAGCEQAAEVDVFVADGVCCCQSWLVRAGPRPCRFRIEEPRTAVRQRPMRCVAALAGELPGRATRPTTLGSPVRKHAPDRQRPAGVTSPGAGAARRAVWPMRRGRWRLRRCGRHRRPGCRLPNRPVPRHAGSRRRSVPRWAGRPG